MSRKRRVFDIEMPGEDTLSPVAETARRGPMASAIAENAEALRNRKSTAQAIREENDALAHEFVALREAGHVVQAVPLGSVHTAMLVRDRMTGEDSELVDLVRSIRDLGLSNPIRVLSRPDGDGYELVQGYRRLSAYRQMQAEGQGDWDTIPALIMPGVDNIAGLYRRMVDENVIRKDLSFAEMAHAAQNYAADPATEAADVTEAVATLFQSAAYSKRSYIRSFAFLLDAVGDALAFPTEVPRALGVNLARKIKEHPEVAGRITAALEMRDNRSVADEHEVLRQFCDDVAASDTIAKPKAKRVGRPPKSKTTFHIRSATGQIKCTAAQDRLEIQAPRDFSTIDRARLEKAIAALVDGLG